MSRVLYSTGGIIAKRNNRDYNLMPTMVPQM